MAVDANRRWSRRRVGAALLGALAGVVLTAVASAWPGMGRRPSGARLQRMQHSAQWGDGIFVNPQPLWNDFGVGNFVESLQTASDFAVPESPADDIPVVVGDGSRFETPPASGLRITWFGHSSVLIEIDGARVLTDPVWGPRSSPVTWAGPERWYPPPVALEDLPRVDAVVISHDHYDHLDYPTFRVLRTWDTTFVVPLGVGSHLEYWGVPPERIVELDWWQRTRVGPLELVCAPARHASGRGVFDQNETLWSGWALRGPSHRVFFSGDTGLFDGLKRVGAELGPFDVTMIEVGAYNQSWPDWHMGPEQAVLAHQWLRGDYFIPIHWGLFDLAFHGWTEPVERVQVAAEAREVRYGVPRPGQSLEPSAAPPPQRWWPEVPWRTAAEDPIVATDANGRPPHGG